MATGVDQVSREREEHEGDGLSEGPGYKVRHGTLRDGAHTAPYILPVGRSLWRALTATDPARTQPRRDLTSTCSPLWASKITGAAALCNTKYKETGSSVPAPCQGEDKSATDLLLICFVIKQFGLI